MSECCGKYFIQNNNVFECEEFKDSEISSGTSLYEVVRIIDGIPLFIEKHLQRLNNSAGIINKELWMSLESQSGGPTNEALVRWIRTSGESDFVPDLPGGSGKSKRSRIQADQAEDSTTTSACISWLFSTLACLIPGREPFDLFEMTEAAATGSLLPVALAEISAETPQQFPPGSAAGKGVIGVVEKIQADGAGATQVLYLPPGMEQ